MTQIKVSFTERDAKGNPEPRTIPAEDIDSISIGLGKIFLKNGKEMKVFNSNIRFHQCELQFVP